MANFDDDDRGGGPQFGAYVYTPQSISQTPILIQLLAGQIANAFIVKNSSGTTLFSVDPSGNLTISGSISAVVSETLTGNVSIIGTLTVTGASTLGDVSATSLAVSGASIFTGNVTANHNLTVSNNLTVNNGVYFNGSITFSTPLPVASGGTGKASLTAYAVLCGGTTATGAIQSAASVGSSGQILTSNGANNLPTFQDASSSGLSQAQVLALTMGS
jgi:hypothetical protein